MVERQRDRMTVCIHRASAARNLWADEQTHLIQLKVATRVDVCYQGGIINACTIPNVHKVRLCHLHRHVVQQRVYVLSTHNLINPSPKQALLLPPSTRLCWKLRQHN